MKIEIKQALAEVAIFVQKALQKELASQGHILTGKLRDSIRVVFQESNSEITVAIEMEAYGEAVDSGVIASRIPYTRGSGAKSSKYIAGLIRFFKLKGLALKNARSAAFATANTHKREGMPTQRSHDFSSNGRRTGFISQTIESSSPTIDRIIERALTEKVFEKFINLL